ncbi:transcription factor mef2A isoform X2 [Drosophila erecta]|nr:transcription factor mef2A isoform X2 [Drosophila erecta]XP_026832451.1 transcription factor mef2A isoform X2 [Drosophila erecta]XP_026832452.1 transcription factor mef2A isoform X2 [Drosophila erecta]
MLDRRTSTPSPINYYKPTDLTYNHRKRKAMGVEHVVGALTLTPIKVVGGAVGAGAGGSAGHHHQQQQQQMNHNQLAFQALQQHFSNNHGLSLSHCNGQPQQQQHHHQQQHQPHQQQQQQQALHLQQQQQQHSSNMALKRDRDRDLSTSNGNGNSNSNSNSSNTNNNTSLDPTATSSNCSSSSNNSGATPPKPLIGGGSGGGGGGSGGGLSANHVDEYGVFGEYVAITIRKLKTSKSKIVVKHLINNLLYEAELGKYDHGMPASKEPPQLYNMQ